MTLNAGTRFGPYEIGAPIGAGGMGEVYRARDTELERDVAIKVLPSSFTSDAARVARFEQEAKALAALNHPNIAHIYGIERSASAETGSAGESAATTTALVIELVEGPTLADRIAQGPIAVDEALGIAAQIAEALEAAHEKGIIHRDLKPANVKLTPNGVVKLLDFGIAKVPEPSTASGGRSPTLLTPALTEAGVLLGTAAYMSPEQAKGRAIDERADIWSFGCVLYEMLTGQPAFGAEDVTTTLARVLEREVDMHALPRAVPAAVKQTIALCLDKDPHRRIRDIGDVRLALEGRFEASAEDSMRVHPFWRRALSFAVTAVTVGVVAIALDRQLVPETTPAASSIVSRFVQPLPISRSFVIADRSAIAVAPDGSSIAFTLDDAVYLRRLGELDPKPIRGTEGGDMPFFSSDGQWVGFTVANRLFKVPTAGGIPVDLGRESTPFGATWLEDGTIVYSRGSEGLMRMSDDGGDVDVVAKPAEGRVVLEPRAVPGADWVLYSDGDTSDLDNADIVALSLSTGERKVVFTGGSDARYVPSGHLLYVRGDALYAAPFDRKTMTVTGAGLPVVDGLSRTPIVSHSGNYDVSNDGMLVYLEAGATAEQAEPVWIDREGREEGIGVAAGAYSYPRLSPDGLRAVLTATDAKASTHLLVLDLVRKVFVPLTNTEGPEDRPVWLPDGKRVAYIIPTVGLFLEAADGTGVRETVSSPNVGWPQIATADGKELVLTSVYGTLRSTGHGGIGVRSLEPGGPELQWLVEPPPGQFRLDPVLSPDDRWLAYESNETGTTEIFVRAFPNVADGLQRVSIAGGEQPLWSRDGSELFYLEPGSPPRLMSVAVENGDVLTLGEPQPVMEWPYPMEQLWDQRGYDVDPSGQRFLALKPLPVALRNVKLSQVHIVQNWFEELKRLVPTE